MQNIIRNRIKNSLYSSCWVEYQVVFYWMLFAACAIVLHVVMLLLSLAWVFDLFCSLFVYLPGFQLQSTRPIYCTKGGMFQVYLFHVSIPRVIMPGCASLLHQCFFFLSLLHTHFWFVITLVQGCKQCMWTYGVCAIQIQFMRFI